MYDEIYSLPYILSEVPYKLEEILWLFRSYKYPKFYGENLQKYSSSWYEKQKENSNFSEYNTSLKYATSLDFTNLRSFPSDKPLLLDPSKTGEGFPFNYL